MKDTAYRIISIIADKSGIDETKITRNSKFNEDLGADSLDTVEIMIEIEQEFGLQIPDKLAEELKTVGDAIDYVEKQINK